MGGSNGNTLFTVFDIDPASFDIVVGGQSASSDVASQVLTSPVPIVAYIQKGGYIRWANSFYNAATDFDLVVALKTTPDNKFIAASLNSLSSSLTLTIAILNRINGTLY